MTLRKDMRERKWRPSTPELDAAIDVFCEYHGWNNQTFNERSAYLMLSQGAAMMKAGTFFAPPNQQAVEDVLSVDVDAVYKPQGKQKM